MKKYVSQVRVIDIYKKYQIPPNLQEHLLRVTKIALFICGHWSGPKVDVELVKKSALLHDLGNIVKFDLKKYSHFLGKERNRVDHWFKIQRRIRKKYDNDDHKATLKMLKEIGVNKRVIYTILGKTFGNALLTEKGKSWELKILLYADLRVGPLGIMSLNERLREITNRIEKYRKRKNLPELVKACQQIEKQIQKNVNFKVCEISDDLIERNDIKLLTLKI